jgi:hypothetical protein
MAPAERAHVFVDEAKAGAFILCAAVIAPGSLPAARRTVADLIMPRQRRLHFVKESDSRRRKIIDSFGDLAEPSGR